LELFTFATETYKERLQNMNVASSMGFFFVLFIMFNKLLHRGFHTPKWLIFTILIITWFLSTLTFYSYSPEVLLTNPQLHFFEPLDWMFNPMAGILLALLFLGYWQYQLSRKDLFKLAISLTIVVLSMTAVFFILFGNILFGLLILTAFPIWYYFLPSELNLNQIGEMKIFGMFILAIPIAFLLMFGMYLLVPDFGEGMIGPVIISSGIMATYLLTRVDLTKISRNRGDTKASPFLFATKSSRKPTQVADIILELVVLLLVLVPSFAMAGLYITDGPLYNYFDIPFIISSMLFPLPLLVYLLSRFDGNN
jgi:hypothetical protein